MFRRLKEALALGADIQKLRADVEQLRMEWTDVLDQMKAREERMRKRDRAKVREIVQDDERDTPPPKPQFPEPDDKTSLRLMARQRGMIR